MLDTPWKQSYMPACHYYYKLHDDVTKWKYFPRCWPFMRGIQRSPMDSPQSQWRGALMFSLIYAWTNGWGNNRDASDWRRHRAHYAVTVMRSKKSLPIPPSIGYSLRGSHEYSSAGSKSNSKTFHSDATLAPRGLNSLATRLLIQQLVQVRCKKGTKAPHYWFFVKKIRWGPMDHPHRWFPIAKHYNDVIMSTTASQITSLTIVYSTVYSGADQRKHQSSASLAFVRGIHRWPMNSPHKRPVTRKMFPFDHWWPHHGPINAESVSVSWHQYAFSCL